MDYSIQERDSRKFQSKQFVDLDLNFKKNPITRDVLSKKGENAIKQSIKNLVMTRIGEKLFSPMIGSYVYNLLFDNRDFQLSCKFQVLNPVLNNLFL